MFSLNTKLEGYCYIYEKKIMVFDNGQLSVLDGKFELVLKLDRSGGVLGKCREGWLVVDKESNTFFMSEKDNSVNLIPDQIKHALFLCKKDTDYGFVVDGNTTFSERSRPMLLDHSDLSVKWRAELTGQIVSYVGVKNDIVVCMSTQGALTILQASDGKVLTSYEGPEVHGFAGTEYDFDNEACAVALSGNYLYFSINSGYLARYDIADDRFEALGRVGTKAQVDTDERGAYGASRRDGKLEVFSHTNEGLKVSFPDLPHLSSANTLQVKDGVLGT